MKIRIEPLLDTQNNPVMQNGQPAYRINDFIGLMQLLRYFDSRMYDMNGYKMYLKTKDKIEKYWREGMEEIDFSKEQLKFLKDFVKVVSNNKELKLQEFELRSLTYLHEELDKQKEKEV